MIIIYDIHDAVYLRSDSHFRAKLPRVIYPKFKSNLVLLNTIVTHQLFNVDLIEGF